MNLTEKSYIRAFILDVYVVSISIYLKMCISIYTTNIQQTLVRRINYIGILFCISLITYISL